MTDSIPAFDRIQSYRKLANELLGGKRTESELNLATVSLPALDKHLLNQIADEVEHLSTTRPHSGWALAEVARDAAHTQKGELFLRSFSSWIVARASNHWVQPLRVSRAISDARRGFQQLDEAGWLAACDWQEHALAWTHPDFTESARALKEALHGLESNGFTEFIPECRLALAYAQILIGQHEEALEHIRLSEETYRGQKDVLNQARCWLHQASSLRRRDHFEEALQRAGEALSIFEQQNALSDQAKAHYQIAAGYLLKANDLAKATDHFTIALTLAEDTELDLWQGMCLNNLGSVHLLNGELKHAEQQYRKARTWFIQHNVLGLLADNLNDSGKLNILMGKPDVSVEQFQQAKEINEKLGAGLSIAIVTSNLGEAYGQLGRYQDALHHLERAIEQLETLQIYFRLATCEKYVALIWSRLGQPQTSHKYLDQAAEHYEMADQRALLASVWNYRAATFFQQGRVDEAVDALEKSRLIAEEFGVPPQAALAKHLLGEALLQSAHWERALPYLELAQLDFMKMGMPVEQAASLVSLGAYHLFASEPERARSAWEEALQLNGGTFPEIDWQAHVELGNLARTEGNLEGAIRSYRLGMDAFGMIQRNFLQPTLAGSYLQKPARTFDEIVSLAAKAPAAVDTLQFIEEIKASTLLRHIAKRSDVPGDSHSQELNDLKVEIDLLRNELRTSFDGTNTLQSALASRKLRDRLKSMSVRYDELKSRFERKQLPNGLPALHPTVFNLELFRRKADSFLAKEWIALDYYITEHGLNIVILTPQDCRVISQPLSNRFQTALDACDQARRTGKPPIASDLETLGRHLIPAPVMETLTPDTVLLIAPHRRLHQVPWSAIHAGSGSLPLVCGCVPCIVPSLQSLVLLWERDALSVQKDRNKGILVGVSSFHGRYEDLPMVREEARALASMSAVEVCLLTDANATWKGLIATHASENWSQFGWLHIASHFSPDRHTGRLSGIALHDGDIWLDQLRDLSPLPHLVSLSACNSNDSFLYEGDERMDLQTTCLIAGTSSVVGSAWRLPDESATELILYFYNHYLTGASPAGAVAYAQRQFFAQGKDLKTWASFQCAGVP